MLRAAAATVAAALLLSVPVVAVPAVSAEKAVLMDADTGRILYEKHAADQSLIASTTKIMTALLVCERCDLETEVKIPPEAVGIEGSSIYLQNGEVLTVETLLYGLMLQSGNDAAVALAIHTAGSVENFVDQMNEKAAELGLEDTHFANPNGLDAEGHYGTARDLAKLASYALRNQTFRAVSSCKQANYGSRYFTNHNKLLVQYDGAVGVKTGYTKAAGRILVSAAERDGKRLVAVTIQDPDDWNDHAALLDYGFAQYEIQTVISEGMLLGTVNVVGGTQDQAELVAKTSLTYAMTGDDAVRIQLQCPNLIYAPAAAGKQVGTAAIWIGAQQIGEIPLILAETIPQKEKEPGFLERLFGG